MRIDFGGLSDVKEFIIENFSKKEMADYMDRTRIDAIAETVQKRISYLSQLAASYRPEVNTSTEDDVEKKYSTVVLIYIVYYKKESVYTSL